MGDVCIVIDKLLKQKVTNNIFNLSSSKSYEIIALAEIVKKVYRKRYQKDIDITINKEDTTVYDLLIVKNDKLRSIIDFEISDNMEEEVEKIFKLLENHE